MKKSKRIQQTTVFNLTYLLYLLGFGFSLWGIIYLLINEGNFSWVLVVICVIFLLVLLFDSVCYVFTKNELIFVGVWGHKRKLPWLYVATIQEYEFWSSYEIPHYAVYYDMPHNGKAIRRCEIIPRTRKIGKCLKMYCGRKITNIGKQAKKRK